MRIRNAQSKQKKMEKVELEKIGFKKHKFSNQRLIIYQLGRLKVMYDDNKPPEIYYKSCIIDINNPNIDNVKQLILALKII